MEEFNGEENKLSPESTEDKSEDKNLNWEHFYSSTTLHGFHYIFDQTGFRRLGWFLILVASFILAIYLFIGVITDYSSFSTLTSWSEKFSQDSPAFPTVTVCNFNSISKTKVKDHAHGDELWNVYKTFFQSYSQSQLPANYSAMLKQSMSRMNKNTMKEFLQAFELSIEDMIEDEIVKSTFSPLPTCFFDKGYCNPSWFANVFTEEYGLCHQMNYYTPGKSSKTMETIKPGFLMFTNIHANVIDLERQPFYGIALLIHPYGTPATSHYSTMVPLSPGTMNMVQITTSESQLLPSPYESSCGTKNYEIVKSSFPYSKALCELDCVARKFKKAIGCVGYSFEDLVDKKHICSADRYFELKNHNTKLGLYRESCRKECPFPCNFLTYSVTSAGTNIGTRNTIQKVAKSTNMSRDEAQKYISENLIGINVLFAKTTISSASVVPSVTWKSMLGSVGGNLGLCLGFSILTLFEFLFYGVNHILRRMTLRKEENTPNGSSIESK